MDLAITQQTILLTSMYIQLLSPLESTPIFECIGLNYKQHAKEAKVRQVEEALYTVYATFSLGC